MPYSTPNARSTLPGRPTRPPFPDVAYSIPPTTTTPGPSNEPPLAVTPLIVSKLRFVSNSQMIEPSFVEYPRMPPSAEPENTTPGITVSAADWAVLQPWPVPHNAGRGGVYHTLSPVSSRTACKPPGSGVR